MQFPSNPGYERVHIPRKESRARYFGEQITESAISSIIAIGIILLTGVPSVLVQVNLLSEHSFIHINYFSRILLSNITVR